MKKDEKNKPADGEGADKDKDSGEGAEKDVSATEDELSALRKEADENLAGWQRAKADFINYKRGQEEMLSELRKYANQDIIMSLLPTVDSFDLATRHLPAELEKSEWVKGVMCIKGMFEGFLRDAGVTEIKALGQKFDPHLHEAVGDEESDEEEGTVIDEVQKGYKMGDRVLRPAKVKIAKNNN